MHKEFWIELELNSWVYTLFIIHNFILHPVPNNINIKHLEVWFCCFFFCQVSDFVMFPCVFWDFWLWVLIFWKSAYGNLLNSFRELHLLLLAPLGTPNPDLLSIKISSLQICGTCKQCSSRLKSRYTHHILGYYQNSAMTQTNFLLSDLLVKIRSSLIFLLALWEY